MSRLLASVGVVALCVSLLLIGGTRANAVSTCDQKDPAADVAVSQTASLGAQTADGWYVTYHVTLTNYGPCNVPDVSFTDAAPASVLGVSTNPSSWTCPTPWTTTISCQPTSTMGVPGTVDLFITVLLPNTSDPTNLATAYVGGGVNASTGAGAGCNDGLASTTCDPYLDNNTSSGGYVTTNSTDRTIIAGGGSQSTSLSVPQGHGLSAQIQQLAQGCPTGDGRCFGKVVSITSSSTAPDRQLKTFTYLLSLLPSYGTATMKYLDPVTGTWVTPPTCRGNAPADPCLLSKSKQKIGNTSYVLFTISTAEDDQWIGD